MLLDADLKHFWRVMVPILVFACPLCLHPFQKFLAHKFLLQIEAKNKQVCVLVNIFSFESPCCKVWVLLDIFCKCLREPCLFCIESVLDWVSGRPAGDMRMIMFVLHQECVGLVSGQIWYYMMIIRTDMRKSSDAQTLCAELFLDCGNVWPDSLLLYSGAESDVNTP